MFHIVIFYSINHWSQWENIFPAMYGHVYWILNNYCYKFEEKTRNGITSEDFPKKWDVLSSLVVNFALYFFMEIFVKINILEVR